MRAIALAVMCVVASGCYRVAINTPAPASGQNDTRSGATFLGLTTVTADANECVHGIARAETVMPAWGFLLQAFTGGLVSGMTAEYHCAAGPEHRATTPAPATAPVVQSQEGAL